MRALGCAVGSFACELLHLTTFDVANRSLVAGTSDLGRQGPAIGPLGGPGQPLCVVRVTVRVCVRVWSSCNKEPHYLHLRSQPRTLKHAPLPPSACRTMLTRFGGHPRPCTEHPGH